MIESARLSAPGSQNSSKLLSVRDNEVPSNVVGQELIGKKVAMKDSARELLRSADLAIVCP